MYKWCIYRITNKVNGKTYIGQHRYSAINDGYFGSGKLLQIAIKKYGKDCFSMDYLITKIPNREYADKAEILYIANERKKRKAEYNIVDGGQGFRGNHSEETKKKIGLASVGNHYAKGKNIGNQNAKGNILSEDTRKRMGASRRGNANNGVAYIKCLETGEVMRTREWIKRGFGNAYQVARGRQITCRGKHFAYV